MESWRSGRRSHNNFISESDLYRLLDSPKIQMINWLQEHGLLAKTYSCPRCKNRGMKLVFTKKCSDGYRWRCGQQTRSLRTGTWFEGSHLTLQEIILVTYHWCHDAQQQHVRRALRTKSFEGVIDWYHYCRKVCMEVMMRSTEKLGGSGGIVEIYESLYWERKRTRQIFGTNQQWIIGGLDQRTGDCFMVPVEDRDLETLETIVRDRILPGTLICTDYLNIFDDLISLEFTDYAVCQSSNLSDCLDDIDNPASELSWRYIKRKLLSAGRKSEYVMSYLAEYVYRRSASKNQDPFTSFLQVISSIYTPQSHDPGIGETVEQDYQVQNVVNQSDAADEIIAGGSGVEPSDSHYNAYGLPLAPETLAQILALAKKSGCNNIEIKQSGSGNRHRFTNSQIVNMQCTKNTKEISQSALSDNNSLEIDNCVETSDSILSLMSCINDPSNISNINVPFCDVDITVEEWSQFNDHTYSGNTFQTDNDGFSESENTGQHDSFLKFLMKSPAQETEPVHIIGKSKYLQLADHTYCAPIRPTIMSKSSRRTTSSLTDLEIENILYEQKDEEPILGRGARAKKKTFKSQRFVTDDSDEEDKIAEKPSEVLFEDENVSGKSMFGFKRNKKRGTMAQRALETISTPIKTQSTFKIPPKTPRTVRTKIKRKIAALVGSSSEEFQDFSESESDFKPTESSASESDIEEVSKIVESDESCSDSENIKTKVKSQNLTNTTSRENDHNYVMQSEHYFSWQANSKIVTSNHTLQKLKTPKLSEDQLQQLLTSCSLEQSTEHDRGIRDLFHLNCCNFNKWMYIMNEGFSILLYGLGSKRDILKTFQKEMLHSAHVVVVNGYFPSLTVKDILDGILVDILEEPDSTSNVYEAVDQIKSYFVRPRGMHLYIILHNIDGPMLRNNKSQNVLSSLASIPNVHLLASLDHINAPLIWDHSKLSKFNFTWWDATSFLPYTDETSFESSMLVQRSGALALSSMTNVYQSLTRNSKGIFRLVVKHQLANKSTKHYLGMPFKVLYSQCRENFLVSSDLALRAQLTEFLDHKLVKSKRSVDGTEQLIIPIQNALLQQFVEQIA